MEVVGAIASVSQLIAYGNSTLLVLHGLYKDLQKDPSIWGGYQSELDLLLHIVQNLSSQHHHGQEESSGAVLAILLDLSSAAQAARTLVTSAQSAGPLGIRWAAVRVAQELPSILKSIQSKREALQLYISESNLAVSRDIRAKMSTNEGQSAESTDQTNGFKRGTFTASADQEGDDNLNFSNSGWGKSASGCDVTLSANSKGNRNVSDSNHYGNGRSDESKLEAQKSAHNARVAANSTTEQGGGGAGNFVGQGRIVGDK